MSLNFDFGWGVRCLRLALLGGLVAVSDPVHARLPLLSTAHTIPLMFEPGSGVRPSEATARAPGLQVRVTPDRVTLWLRGSGGGDGSDIGGGWRELGFRLCGVTGGAALRPEAPLAARVNRFHGNDPAQWRTGIPTFGRVRVSECYPGIDLVYYGNGRELEYDFVVGPGADAGRIGWRVEGAEEVWVGPEGDLVLQVGGREIRQRRPVAYQESNGVREPVQVDFLLEPGATPRVGFRVGAYDAGRPLVIDPVVTYVSYLGGALFDSCREMVLDSTGHLYVAGETASRDFPVTTNALYRISRGGPNQPENPLGNEVFVARFTPDGRQLLFATYLGGTEIDAALGLAVDPRGGVWVCGLTMSTNFPVTPDALSSRIHGEPTFGYYQWDAFLVRLSEDGSELKYSTYIGGRDEDEAVRVRVGSDGRVYVAGDTLSKDFPAAYPAQENPRAYRGARDAFALCLEGTNLVYSVLLGGTDREWLHGMALGPLGEVWLGGESFSDNLPATNAFQASARYTNVTVTVSTNTSGQLVYTTNTVKGVNLNPGFLARLRRDGALDLMSYFGNDANVSIRGVALDTLGRVHLAGDTVGASGPFVAPAWTNGVEEVLFPDPPPEDDADARRDWAEALGTRNIFVAMLDPSGQQLLRGIRFIAEGTDYGWGLDPGPAGAVTVAGSTSSGDFPMEDPLQPLLAGSTDALVIQLEPTGDALRFSTYLGGPGTEELYGVTALADGQLWLAGWTTSSDWVQWAGVGGYQTNFAGGSTDEFEQVQGDGLLLRLWGGGSPRLELLSGAGDTVLAAWPGALVDYGLQVTPTLTWVDIYLYNVGGRLGFATNLSSTNVGGTNVVVTNIVPIITGGTNYWSTNVTAPPAESRDLVSFTNVGGTFALVTNVVSTNVNGKTQKRTNVVHAIIGGTNYYVTNFVATTWVDYPVPPVLVGGRLTVALTNPAPTDFFRLRRRSAP